MNIIINLLESITISYTITHKRKNLFLLSSFILFIESFIYKTYFIKILPLTLIFLLTIFSIQAIADRKFKLDYLFHSTEILLIILFCHVLSIYINVLYSLNTSLIMIILYLICFLFYLYLNKLINQSSKRTIYHFLFILILYFAFMTIPLLNSEVLKNQYYFNLFLAIFTCYYIFLMIISYLLTLQEKINNEREKQYKEHKYQLIEQLQKQQDQNIHFFKYKLMSMQQSIHNKDYQALQKQINDTLDEITSKELICYTQNHLFDYEINTMIQEYHFYQKPYKFNIQLSNKNIFNDEQFINKIKNILKMVSNINDQHSCSQIDIQISNNEHYLIINIIFNNMITNIEQLLKQSINKKDPDVEYHFNHQDQYTFINFLIPI